MTTPARLRLRFSKLGKIRFTSHRDVARLWERAFRKVRLPVASTQGFSPRPKVSFGLALSTGHESLAEYLDVELVPGADIDVDTLPAALSAALPAGLDVTAGAPLDERGGSLQQEVTCCSWRITLLGVDAPRVEHSAAELLGAEQIVTERTRKGQAVTDDIRPLVRALTVVPAASATDGVGLLTDLATQPRALRPAELVQALLPEADDYRVLRTHQWIEGAGDRWEPLPLGARAPLHTRVVC